MATTTNYGWTTPNDTDLVKDGAAAIRTLGSSVDTTTKALNPSTTLGDIEYRSATSNTNTRLGIGTTGQVLTVAGGVPSWATPAAGGGKVLQVVQGTFTGTAQTTSTTMASSGLTVSITPSSATSKVLILASISGVAKTGGNVNTAVKLELVRGATKIMDLSDVNAYNNTSDSQDIGSVAANCLDTPATTSATSYTINFASYQSGQTVYINNYRASDTTRSSIIAMEIGA
jgi:hypothetical protein